MHPQPKLKLMLKSKRVKAWRRGDKWIEIRKLTDVCPSFQVGWIIELEWLGICRVTEAVWFLCTRKCKRKASYEKIFVWFLCTRKLASL